MTCRASKTTIFSPLCAVRLSPRARLCDHVLLRGPSIAQGRARSDMGKPNPRSIRLARPFASRAPSSHLSRFLPRRSGGNRTRLTSPSPLPHPARSQILAHQPNRANKLNRHKSASLSVSDACNIIMKPPSPLVRRPCLSKPSRQSFLLRSFRLRPPRRDTPTTRADLTYRP